MKTVTVHCLPKAVLVYLYWETNHLIWISFSSDVVANAFRAQCTLLQYWSGGCVKACGNSGNGNCNFSSVLLFQRATLHRCLYIKCIVQIVNFTGGTEYVYKSSITALFLWSCEKHSNGTIGHDLEYRKQTCCFFLPSLHCHWNKANNFAQRD